MLASLAPSTFGWLLALGLLWAIAFCLFPHFVDHGDDRGNGLDQVIIPARYKAPAFRIRTVAFFFVGAGFCALSIGLQRYQPSKLYNSAVGDLATNLTNQPSEVQGYTRTLPAEIQVLWVVALITLAVVMRLSWGRRLAVMAHGALYLFIAMSIQAIDIAIGIRTNLPVGPTSVVAIAIGLFTGVLVSFRMIFTTFALPKPNALPIRRKFHAADNVMLIAAILTGLAVPVCILALVAEPSFAGSEWRSLLPRASIIVFGFMTTCGLVILGGVRPRLPQPYEADQPPLDVITPAYNEELSIALTLMSIDRAAGRYGGRVRAIVSNDGSSDATVEVATATMRNFRHATGVLINHPNTGKSGALNRALAVAETDVVVRLDSDCVLHEDAFKYAMPWFEDPEVGMVGSMVLPRSDRTNWYAKMRGIECLIGFGLNRFGQQLVDGITVIPGEFTAFRRGPTLEAGGFTQGINGEDSDQTMQMGRLGYRVVLDRRVLCYDDVPSDINEWFEQRARWSRGVFEIFVRHEPFRNGFAGPRTWFYIWRAAWGFGYFAWLLLFPIFFILSWGSVQGVSPVYFVTVPLALFVPWLALLVISARQFHYWKVIPWVPTYLVFAMMRRVAILEAILSWPTRPLLSRSRPDNFYSVMAAVNPDAQVVSASQRFALEVVVVQNASA